MSRIVFFNRSLKDLAGRSVFLSVGRSSSVEAPYFLEIGGLDIDMAETVASNLSLAARVAVISLDDAARRNEAPPEKTLFHHEDFTIGLFSEDDIAGLEIRCGGDSFRFTGDILQQLFYGLARLGGEISLLRRASAQQRQQAGRHIPHPHDPVWL
jgi:hypothetical protein